MVAKNYVKIRNMCTDLYQFWLQLLQFLNKQKDIRKWEYNLDFIQDSQYQQAIAIQTYLAVNHPK